MFCEDDAAVEGMIGCLTVGTSPVYGWPSSPMEKVRVEQKPSEEVIRSVRPSFDLHLLEGMDLRERRQTKLDP